MRGENISKGVKFLDDMEKFPNGLIHRFLPSELESKYEAMDFIRKFGLGSCDFINISNGCENLLELEHEIPDTYYASMDPNLLLDKVNIIVSCGSSSLQAFKITRDGGKVLLPISYLNKDDETIKGDKSDINLSVESLLSFGGSSTNQDIAVSVLNFLKANASTNDGINTNVIFVNQLGYAIKGFNPRDGSPYVPSYTEKVVSLKYPILEDGFTTNNGKTALVDLLNRLINGEIEDERLTLLSNSSENMFYLVARQCKVEVNGIKEELAGQWANMTLDMIKYEPYLQLNTIKDIGFVMDLGGSSGNVYSVSEKGACEKVNGKSFMKETSPNDLASNLDGFFSQFATEYNTLFD